MNSRFTVLCFLTAGAALASVPELSMPLPRIEVPPLSLRDRKAPEDMSRRGGDVRQWFHRQAAVTATNPSALSQMPVVRPPDDIDPKMIHEPAPGIDYKMLIKRVGPAPQSAPRPLGTQKSPGPKTPDSKKPNESER